MTTKTLYMVEHSGIWNGFLIGVERNVYERLHEAQEAAREVSNLSPVIYEIECREVCFKCKGTGEAESGGVQPWGEQILVKCDCQFEPAKQGEGQ